MPETSPITFWCTKVHRLNWKTDRDSKNQTDEALGISKFSYNSPENSIPSLKSDLLKPTSNFQVSNVKVFILEDIFDPNHERFRLKSEIEI